MFQSSRFPMMKKFLCSLLIVALSFGQNVSYAQSVMLPAPGAMLGVSSAFTPAILKGMVIHPEDPLKFDFLMDTGSTKVSGDDLHKEADKAIKYFLASLTVPEDDLWVNLSPVEKDRVVPESFGQTVMGRDLLSEDYILKQLSASLLDPDTLLGKDVWKKLYAAAQETTGSTEVDVSKFNRVWIVPSEAKVWEHDGKVVILNSHLKVMLDSDYKVANSLELRGESLEQKLADGQNDTTASTALRSTLSAPSSENLSKQIFRDALLPILEKEVNEGANFARLRQVYAAMILSTWYKVRLKDSLLGQAYVDKNKVSGVEFTDGADKQAIYDQYLSSVRKGVINFIREDADPATGDVVPRKYFSGGFIGKALKSMVMAALLSGAVTSLPTDVQAQVLRSSEPAGEMVRVAAGVSDAAEGTISHDPMLSLSSDAAMAPLLQQSFVGNLVQVMALVIAGEDINQVDSNGITALSWASYNGHVEVVRWLLAQGAKLDIESKFGSTALSAAATKGYADIVKLLLDAGIKLDVRNFEGSTALLVASDKGHTDIVRMLLEKGAGIDLRMNIGATPLYVAAQNGHADIVKLLIKKGAAIDIRQNDGTTALMMAAHNGHTEVVKLLMEKGAGVNLQASGGQSSLYSASLRGHAEIVSLLIGKNADLDLGDLTGATPLLLAAQNGYVEIVKMLIAKGAKVSLQTNDGATPLLMAAQFGHVEIVKLLLAAGAKANLQTANGSTALIVASFSGYLEIVQLLLSRKVDLSSRVSFGGRSFGALGAARMQGHAEVARILEQAGAKDQAMSDAPVDPSEKSQLEVSRVFGPSDSAMSFGAKTILWTLVLGLPLGYFVHRLKNAPDEGSMPLQARVNYAAAVGSVSDGQANEAVVDSPEVRILKGQLHVLLEQFPQDVDAQTKVVEQIKALGSIATEALMGMLNDPSGEIRGNIIFILGQLGDRQAIDVIIKALGDEYPVNWRAAGALIFLSDPKAQDALINISGSPYPEVRQNIAMALSRIPTSESEAVLIRMIWDRDEIVRFAALHSLASLGKPEISFSYLNESGRGDSSWMDPGKVQGNSLGDLEYVLGEMGRWNASLFEQQPAGLIMMELFSLRNNFPWDDLVNILISELNNPDDRIKKGAAWMLGVTGDPRGKNPLLALSQKSPSWVADAAKEGLAAYQEYSVVNRNIANMLTESRNLIGDLDELRASLGGYELAAAVADQFGQVTAEERGKIIRALGVSGRASGVKLLTAAYATASEWEKFMIFSALASIGGQEAKTFLLSLREDETSALARYLKEAQFKVQRRDIFEQQRSFQDRVIPVELPQIIRDSQGRRVPTMMPRVLLDYMLQQRERKAGAEDKAMSDSSQAKDKVVGGIDLDPAQLNLQIKRDGNGVVLPADQQDWSRINIQGLTPIIYSIQPVNMPMLLGLDTSEQIKRLGGLEPRELSVAREPELVEV